MKHLFFYVVISFLLISCGDDNVTDSTAKAPTVSEKKQNFKDLLIPAIEQAYTDLNQQYLKIKQAIKDGEQQELIAQLKTTYKVTTNDELLMALKPHPKSIVIAQAAMESGWATSRIFKEANNVFGVWSFNENEPRIAAAQKRGDKTIYLKKYATIADSVKDNYKVLATGRAFKEFRELRMKTDNPFELVKKLDKYSEIGDKYGKELASMIRFNQFNKLDETFYP